MKRQLQNNFTTPEQSKRLLGLGLPADTADCVIATYKGITKHSILCYHYSSYGEFVEKAGNTASIAAIHPNEEYIPCWSVGRLIEIITICCNHYSGNNDIIFNQDAVNHGIIECLVAYLAIEKKDVSVDFSKLEE